MCGAMCPFGLGVWFGDFLVLLRMLLIKSVDGIMSGSEFGGWS